MNQATVRGYTTKRVAADRPIAVELDGVSIAYSVAGRLVDAVDDVSVAVPAGSTLGLVGESGSGKTTVAHSIMRSLPSGARVTAGSIRYHGQDLLALGDERFRGLRWTQLAMVFQNALEALNPVLTVGHQIADVLVRRGGVKAVTARRQAAESLTDVGLDARWAGAYPHQLSGGMRQRVMIALALACEPKLIIADEPTTALDVVAQQEIIDLLKKIKRERDATLIVISHDLHMISQICDEVAVMYAGRIVEFGSRSGVLDSPRHPYTRALLDAYPRVSGPISAIRPLRGDPPSLGHMPQGCRFHPRCPVATGLCQESKPARRGGGDHWSMCHFSEGDPL